MNLILASIIRHLLTAVAGGLVAVGVADHDAANLAHAAEPVVGGLVVYGIGQAWSIFDKKSR